MERASHVTSSDASSRSKLTRLERDIVWQLEETGAESVVVVLNSLSNRGEHYPTREHVLEAFLDAVKNLLRRRLVTIVMGSMRQPLAGPDALIALFVPQAFTWAEGRAWQVTGPLASAELAEGPRR